MKLFDIGHPDVVSLGIVNDSDLQRAWKRIDAMTLAFRDETSLISINLGHV